MKPSRYVVTAEITVTASADRAFAVAVDPTMIRRYETGISSIDVIQDISPFERIVRTHLTVSGFRVRFLYRYRYSPVRRYTGVQEPGSPVRGFFSFSFEPTALGTRIVHREGVHSPLPFVAPFVGWLYFRLLARNGLESELARLKTLIEAISVASADHQVKGN